MNLSASLSIVFWNYSDSAVALVFFFSSFYEWLRDNYRLVGYFSAISGYRKIIIHLCFLVAVRVVELFILHLLFCFICVPGPLLFYGVRNKHSVHPTFSAFIATDLIYRLKEKCLSLPPVVCLIYVICVCLCTVVPNAYCVVFFFVLCTLGFYDSTFFIVPFCIF